MKKCPFCAEEIQDEAMKCKHCGSFVDGRSENTTEKSQAQVKTVQVTTKTGILGEQGSFMRVLNIGCLGIIVIVVCWFLIYGC